MFFLESPLSLCSTYLWRVLSEVPGEFHKSLPGVLALIMAGSDLSRHFVELTLLGGGGYFRSVIHAVIHLGRLHDYR